MTDGAQIPGGLEIRAAVAELRSMPDSRRLEGHAAVWNIEARIGGAVGGFREEIFPNAFQGSLRSGRDIVALWDHSPQHVLGRTKAGTLSLHEDTRGLAFVLDVAPTSYGTDLLALVRSGNAGGCSFGFLVDKDNKNAERWRGDKRELRGLILHEISIVSWAPAYEGTSVNSRSRLHVGPCASVVRRRRLVEML